MVLRISLLVAGTFMLTYTTSPIALTDGLESLLGPLKKLGAPVLTHPQGRFAGAIGAALAARRLSR